MGNIAFRSKLFATFGLLLVLALSMSSLALWGIQRSQFYIERSRLAHEVLDGHLRVAETGQRLLRLLIVPAADSDAVAAREGEARQKIDAEFRRIRTLISREVALLGVGNVEADELERLAWIERDLAATIRAYETSRALFAAGRLREGMARAGSLNTYGAGSQWRGLISAAIDEETREVAEINVASAALARRLQLLLLLGGLTTTAVVAAALLLLRRDLDAPLARLVAGANAFAKGDLAFRIDLQGNAELPRLAQRFDRMAAELQRQQADLAAARGGLEREVDARTAELRTANAQLAFLDGNRRRLLADISHELRTPLTVVRGEAEVTLRGKDTSPAEYRGALDRVREQAEHMGRLVDDLLFVARQEAGEVRLKLRTLGLRDLISRACADMAVLVRDSDGDVRCELPDDEVRVQADPDRLRQLLFILIDNGLRYARAAAAVTVQLLPTPRGALISVSDRGMGIPAAELPFVFERFHRAANAMRHDAQGSGLGLFMARAIVAAHGGTIEIASVEDEGTTVSVMLPGGGGLRAVA